ncbi:PHP domain-containing protein [Bacillus sp. JJ1562]|uniref:PHP domain-containing protein n=1 Tax=Bacillus sp. JJ1562 TaxID=3122960 RepID=UPI003002510C
MMNLMDIVRSGSFDLHIHTTASDGDHSPKDILKKASSIGLNTIAITDHDTLDGLHEAIEAGKKYGVTVIPGIELSTKFNGKTVDILGYNVSPTTELSQVLKQLREERETRAIKIIEKFKAIGMPITIEDVFRYSKGEVISRPHIAKAIVEKGYVEHYQTVFDEFLADGKPCSIDKKIIIPEEGIKLIQNAGGLAVLAHPVYLKGNMIDDLLHFPFDGIEVWHRNHSKEDAIKFIEIAKKLDLIMTGGSDFHTDDHNLGKFGYFPVQ